MTDKQALIEDAQAQNKAAVAPQDAPVDPAIESIARKFGWTPESEMSAQAFYDNGAQYMEQRAQEIVAGQTRVLQNKIAQLDKELETINDRDINSTQAHWDEQIIYAQTPEARAEALKRRDEALASLSKPQEETQAAPPSEHDAFFAANPWMNEPKTATDNAAAAYAHSRYDELKKERPFDDERSIMKALQADVTTFREGPTTQKATGRALDDGGSGGTTTNTIPSQQFGVADLEKDELAGFETMWNSDPEMFRYTSDGKLLKDVPTREEALADWAKSVAQSKGEAIQ